MSFILDGLQLSKKIEADLKSRISVLNILPKLAIVQVGEKKESEAYIARKIKYGQNIGALTEHVRVPANVSQDDLNARIEELNSNPSIHGIIIQLPVSEHLNFTKAVEIIDWRKDVDGLSSQNVHGLWQNNDDYIMPATVRGVIELLAEYKIPVAGQKVVIVNRSILVGRPLAIALLNRDATVTIAHSKTRSLKEEIHTAHIVVTAVGKPKMFGRDYFKKGQIIIDVGISFGNQKVLEETKGMRLSGDVDFENVKDIVEALSPVPGGVGPMTVACLFKNLLKAYELQRLLTS